MSPLCYSASWLFPGDGPAIRDGWIMVEGGWITATGRASEAPPDVPPEAIRRFDDGVLLPGLVNMHCHLELTSLHEKLDEGKPFPVWVEQLRGYTAALGPENYRHAAKEGVRQLIDGGCTTVLDVGNTGDVLKVLAAAPLRSFACVETLGLDPAFASHRYETALAHVENAPATDRFNPGVAPHAAYSMSADLLRRVIDHQRARGLPVTIHAAESREEAVLFAHGTGPLADYCRRIYPDAPRHHDTTPVRWLESEGLIPDGLILVHGNTLDEKDMEILARRGTTVVHCPSSHRFFGHPRFPYEALQAHGINVALGTDSLASGDSLSMLEQMRLFGETYPDVPLEKIVAMATINGAKALGLSDLGLLKKGHRADFMVATESDSQKQTMPFASDVSLSVIQGTETV